MTDLITDAKDERLHAGVPGLLETANLFRDSLRAALEREEAYKRSALWYDLSEKGKTRTVIYIQAELTRLRAELSEATDACNGLHEMVKDLQKDNARLRSIVSRVEDVEGIKGVINQYIVAEMAAGYANFRPIGCARAVREYIMGGKWRIKELEDAICPMCLNLKTLEHNKTACSLCGKEYE